MKRPRYIPSIAGITPAHYALLLVIMVALWLMASTLAHGRPFHSFGVTSLGVTSLGFTSLGFTSLGFAWICGITVLVAGLVLLKFLADRRLEIDRELLDAFLENIPDNVYFKDRDSRFVRISRAMSNAFGLADPAHAVNKTDSEIFSSEHAEQALRDEQEIIRTGQPMPGIEEKETWPDGHESWVLTTKVPLRNRRGQIIGTMGISHNITDRKQAEARIQYMALHDALTGLPNRILLQDRLTQAMALACRNQKKVAVLMLDLDRFKNVNDSLGHHIGDRLLEAVSTRLKACLRKSDIVARFGGDEFVLGLPLVGGSQDAEQVAQKVLSTLVEPFRIEGHKLQISGSIGISLYPDDGETPEAMLQTADAAMYEAKSKVRGTFCFFTPGLYEEAKRRQSLEKDLHGACERGEFILHYQPLVSAESGHITGVEALLRWKSPEQGLIPPNQFIPLLEDLGLMSDVGHWVLRTACLQNVAWQKEGIAPIRVTVNVSAQQFHRSDLVSIVREVLCETGLDPQWLELELTESLTLNEAEATIKIMQDLKQLGVSLSLDDFGTGWSSLSYLRRFPLDRLKIDRSFMRDTASQPAAKAVVNSIMDLARNLGLACTGEGVETKEQLEYLQEHKCPEIQGFLSSPPLPVAECGRLLRSAKSQFMVAPGVAGIDVAAIDVAGIDIEAAELSSSLLAPCLS